MDFLVIVHAFNFLVEDISTYLHSFSGSLAVSRSPALTENKHPRENLIRLTGRQRREKKIETLHHNLMPSCR